MAPHSLPRVALLTVGLSLGLAAVGTMWGLWRYGASEAALAGRVEREVRQTIADEVTSVTGLAARVAAEGTLIVDAAASRERLADLFDRLRELAAPDGAAPVAVTVYTPATAGGYQVLAWSDGPGEQGLTNDRLVGPAAVFVTPGYAGLRLVALRPVTAGGVAVAVAVAETVLTTADRRLPTSYGPVPVVEFDAEAADAAPGDGFLVTTSDGLPLVRARLDATTVASGRRTFFARVAALSLLPLPLALSIAGARWADRRRRPATARDRWRRVLVLAAAAGATAGGTAALAHLAGAPPALVRLLLAVGLVFVVTLLPAATWWQAARHHPTGPTMRLVAENLGGGLALAATLEAAARLLADWMTLEVLERGPFAIVPFSPMETVSIGTILLAETALAWGAATVLAALAIRWRLLRSGPPTAVALIGWLAPPSALILLPSSTAGSAGPVVALVAVMAGIGALGASWLHRTYRHTTQSVRLLLALLAALVPLLALYPLAAETAWRATRTVIEDRYAPAAAGHPQELRAELGRAQASVDEMTFLPDLVGALPTADSRPAHLVWNQTGLQRSRVISDVELYGPDRTLVSRFAFNLPEYLNRAALQTWQGSSCPDPPGAHRWEVFGEVTPFGAEERLMLHAERAICTPDGQLLGGIVLHVASNDYEALPFISSLSPYAGIVGGEEGGPQLRDVRLAVYGWSGRPIFTSERAAWAVPAETFDRLYRTGDAFWVALMTDSGPYDVFFLQNRAGIYALGVPDVSLVEHATRLAEMAVLTAVFFVLWQVGLLAHAVVARRPHAPIRRVFDEVRTSFYRKLFIAFVIVAVVPVVVAALAFGSYMTAQFRADVDFEASTTVTMAQRVFRELTASTERAGDVPDTPNDDVMIWIRQVIDHDVNLFEASELTSTSQRDLFESGFLPTRTPAAVYRAIALERRPSYVTDGTVGGFSYIVAAAPVAAWGRDAVLTVPLAPRQREMERELDTLNRRVLAGAVFVVLLAAGFGASLAGRISNPVARLSRATRQIAAGHLDVRVATDRTDELRRLVDDFNSMAATLEAQRTELARTNQLKAWNEMARQVAHEIKNPLTPVQLAAEHLQQVHRDRGRPLGDVLDRCVMAILEQVRLLRRIASEFANFAGDPVSRPTALLVPSLLHDVVEPYRVGIGTRVRFEVRAGADLPVVLADRTLLQRALTNLVENAVQAMPEGGTLTLTARASGDQVIVELADTGVGMSEDALAHAFEPYFSTKTGGSGLGLANARRNIEREGGTVEIASVPGQGTVVTVTLRAQPAVGPPSAADGDRAPSR